MAVEDECHCSDSSEPSNLTSLQTDMSSTMTSSEQNKNGVSLTENDPSSRPVRQVPPQQYSDQGLAYKPVVQNGQVPVACHCPYAYRTSPYKVPKRDRGDDNSGSVQEPRPLRERLNFKWPRKHSPKQVDMTYQVKVKKNQNQSQNCPKSYVCCEISEGIPKRGVRDYDKFRTPRLDVEDGSEKIDIYYFDHGNSAYYRTTDAPPILATEKCAERTDYIATRFWAEIFGTVHIGMAFVTAFILQLIRFLLFSIVRPLTVGVVQLTADYFLKPSLSICFNATIQPVLILLYNIATSFRDLCEPLAEGLGFFLREIAQLFRAFRIVEVNNTGNTKSCT